VKRRGDIVVTPPGTEDWHDAAPDSFIDQLADSKSSTEADVADVEWDDHVSDDKYSTTTTGGEIERSRR